MIKNHQKCLCIDTHLTGTYHFWFQEINIDQLVQWGIKVGFESKQGPFIGYILKTQRKKYKSISRQKLSMNTVLN